MSAGIALVLTVSVLLSLFIAGLSQASTPDYRQLWWIVLTLALLQLPLAAVYSMRVRHWTRWIALGLALVALASFGEFTARVWF